jgi:hypothetical protein
MDSIEMVLEGIEGWNPLKRDSVNELKSMVGVTMEDYIAVRLSRWLEEKGCKCDVRTRVTITVNPVTGDSREVDVIAGTH